MGAKTYADALKHGWPYGETPLVVCTHQSFNSKRRFCLFLFQGDLIDLVERQLKLKYENVWMVGGSMLTKEFIRQGLADEIVISMMPVLLGGGTLFFDFIGQQHKLHLKDVVAYKDGMVEMRYAFKVPK